MKTKRLFIFSIFVPMSVYADCGLLLQHGITNITRYQSAEHAIVYKWHKYCGVDYRSSSDSQVARASVAIFGYGDGGGGTNSSHQRQRLIAWCDKNSDFAEKNSVLFQETETLSVPALSSWEQCIAMSQKQIDIKFLPAGENGDFVHFEIDSKHDGTLKYLGVQAKNYRCTESMVRPDSGTSVDISRQPDINNANIQIDCEREKPKVTEKNGVGRIKYEIGYIAINTSGPSFSISFPEVVSEYYVTPPNSVVAFNSNRCPEGWSEFTPLYGRFIRGVDKSGSKIDPDGQRPPAHIQGDMLAAHSHEYDKYITHRRSGRADIDRFNAPWVERGMRANSTTKYGGPETRPKNVALLYCEKK
jgi:hypothetical protein